MLHPDTVILSTSDLLGNIIDYNQAFREVSGYEDADLKGKSHSVLRHPDMPKAVFQDLWRTIQAGKPWFGIVKNRRKNGDYYWITANVTPIIEEGNVSGYLSVRYPASLGQVVTAETLYLNLQQGKVAFTQTLPRHESLSRITAMMSVGVIALTLVQAWMPLAPLAHLHVELAGFSLLALGFLGYRATKRDQPSSTLERAVERIANGHFREPVNDTSYWGFALNMIRSRLGEASARLYDTVKKEAEAKFAMDAVQAQTRFLVSMSHELRTPLNGMIATSQRLMQTLKDHADQPQAQMMYASTTQLSCLIYNLLDYVSLEHGQLRLRSGEIEVLSWLCVDTLRSHVQTAQEKGLLLTLELSAGVPAMLEGDRDRLSQIVTNLIGNAIKFTDKGQVSLHITKTATHHNGMVELQVLVSDSGCGMSHEEVEKVFTPFSQVDYAGRKIQGGTGLGLVVTQRLVQMMRGDIRIRSQVGSGTFVEVTLVLPQIGDQTLPATYRRLNDAFSCQDAMQYDKAVATQVSPSMRILVVEDNMINQAVIRSFLESLGLTDIQFADHGEAFLSLQQPSEHHFDAVLMDCLMPVMDGYEATRQWRDYEQTHQLPRMPIIALTANAILGDEEACYSAGMDDYLTKPVNIDRLASRLQYWYDRTHSPTRS